MKGLLVRLAFGSVGASMLVFGGASEEVGHECWPVNLGWRNGSVLVSSCENTLGKRINLGEPCIEGDLGENEVTFCENVKLDTRLFERRSLLPVVINNF